MYNYYIEEGNCASDMNNCIISSLTEFTRDEFHSLFLIYQKENKIFNIWSFAEYLIKNHAFFWPKIRATINLENYKSA